MPADYEVYKQQAEKVNAAHRQYLDARTSVESAVASTNKVALDEALGALRESYSDLHDLFGTMVGNENLWAVFTARGSGDGPEPTDAEAHGARVALAQKVRELRDEIAAVERPGERDPLDRLLAEGAVRGADEGRLVADIARFRDDATEVIDEMRQALASDDLPFMQHHASRVSTVAHVLVGAGLDAGAALATAALAPALLPAAVFGAAPALLLWVLFEARQSTTSVSSKPSTYEPSDDWPRRLRERKGRLHAATNSFEARLDVMICLIIIQRDVRHLDAQLQTRVTQARLQWRAPKWELFGGKMRIKRRGRVGPEPYTRYEDARRALVATVDALWQLLPGCPTSIPDEQVNAVLGRLEAFAVVLDDHMGR